MARDSSACYAPHSQRIGNSTALGEVWHGFWARNHCGYPKSELTQLINGRGTGRKSTFDLPHTQPSAQRIQIVASTSHQLTR